MKCTNVLSTLLLLCLFVFLFAIQLLANNPDLREVQGTTFVQDSKGQSYIANAKVTLKGPARETETDQNGKFEFREIQPGTYTIEAAAPRLLATQVVTVETGNVAQIPLELLASTVQDRMTVTAAANEALTSSPFPSIPTGGERRLKARVGFAAFDVFNHFNPRNVQNSEESARFGGFFNNAWHEYRGKFVVEF